MEKIDKFSPTPLRAARCSCPRRGSGIPSELVTLARRFCARLQDPKICPGQVAFKMVMVIGASSLRRRAAVTGVCVVVALSSLAWGGPGWFLGTAMGASNHDHGSLATSAPTLGSGVGTIVATVPVGNGPWGVGHDSGNGYAYVANSGSNTTSVISGTTVVATIPVESFPLGVGYNSGNGHVYVANLYSKNVSVISGTIVVATISVGKGPIGVAYDSGNGYVYVANSYSNNVTVISGTTVVATIPVGNLPRGVGYDNGHGYVYVTNWGSNTVSVIATLESPTPPSIFTLSPLILYSVVGVIVGLVVIVSVAFALRKRQRRLGP